ncbi:MAG: hypothetical protein H0W61_06750 [Bacteroidetes bacterium]|nr:hypothetical protein [Bacteroidota bacterium]
MNTKSLFNSALIVAIALTLGLSSCKKRKAFKEEDGQTSEDSRTAQSENDASISDVNTEIGNNTLLHGRLVTPSEAAQVQKALGVTAAAYTIDTTGAYTGTIKINYNGTTVNNRTRTGSIRLTIIDYALGKRWKNPGCVVKVDYLAYKVTRASDGKSVQLDGTQNVTNISGSSWFELLFLPAHPSIITSVTGTGLNVTFDGSKTAVYNINRKFTYSLPNGILTCTGEGIGSSDGVSNLENYGTTRDGDSFTSEVTTPIVWNWTCGAWAPIQGEVNIKVQDKEFTLKCLFGTDASGNAVAVGSNSCPYGFKVQWSYKSKTNKKIFGYH